MFGPRPTSCQNSGVRRKHRVEITASAERDALAIRDHIARDKPSAARQWVRALRLQIRSLERLPSRGVVIPEADLLGVEYRQLLHGNYRTIYRVEGARVIVVRVVHGARRLNQIP